MNNLADALYERDSSYIKQTYEILDSIAPIMLHISKFLNTVDPLCQNGTIVWDEINIIDDLIYLSGIVSQTLGARLKHNGEDVVITEENAKSFQAEVFVHLPLSLIEKGDVAEIVDFLYKIYNEAYGQSDEQMITPSVALMDFDLSELTNEQKLALMDNTTTKKN